MHFGARYVKGGRVVMTEPSSVVAEYVESVWNQGDIQALRRLTSPEFQYHLGGQPPRDRSGMEDFVAATHRAFPDWRVDILTTVAQGDHVAVRWSGTVTHGGEFHGIPASGNRITVGGINLYRIAQGRVDAEWEQMDTIGMLRQLGVGM
jgi:steroid delta-isomerase-like uncharacterized protein